MSRSILLTALRRSAGLYAFPLFLVLEAVNVLSQGRDWAADWLWTSSASNSILVLLGPLAAGVAAAESVQLRRRGADALLRLKGVRAGRLHTVRVLALAAWVGFSHAIGIVAMWIVALLRHDQWGWLNAAVILPTFLLILAFVSVGAAVGWWLPKVVTPPVVALAGYLLPGLGVMPPALFLIAGWTGSLIGLEYRTDLIGAQAAWWAVVAVAGMIALGRASWQRWASLAVAAAVAVLCAGQVGALGPDDLQIAQGVPALTCTGAKPQVCVSAEVPASLAPVAEMARPLSAALDAFAGTKSAERIVTVPMAHPPTGTVIVPSHPNPPYAQGLAVANALVRAKTACPLGDDATYVAVRGVARYLLTEVPTASAPAFSDEPPTEAQARVLLADLQRRCGG